MVWFFNSHWHHCSTVTCTIVQQSLAWLINNHWHDSSLVAGTIVQQSLAPFFNSHWHECSTVTGMIVQQSLTWLFNSGWHDCSTVTGTTDQQVLAWLGSVHILHNQQGGEGRLLKMVILDYGGGGRGKWIWWHKLIKKLNSVFFLCFHFILVLFCLNYTNNSQRKEFLHLLFAIFL